MSSPRIPRVPREAWDADVEAALRAGVPRSVGDAFLSTGSDAVRVPNAIATMAHHPRLAGPFLAYNSVLLREPRLGPRLRELLVLRVAWRARSEYEWVQHVKLSARYEVTREEVAAIATAECRGDWSPLEADLLAAADQLIDDHVIDDPTWRRLAGQLDAAQLVELVFTVGTYTCLAMVFNSLGLELDPEIESVDAPPLSTAKG